MARRFAWYAALLVVAFGGAVAYAQTSPARFGQHFPHGLDAVNYIYGPNGMWRDQSGLQYVWKYYEQCATDRHPFARTMLIIEGSAQNMAAPDADCLILSDLNNDGELSDDRPAGFAFIEHSGRGVAGERTAPPFHQFWFDDNWLARYVAEAYNREHPIGLHDHGYTIRWRVLGGDNSHFTPYPPSPHVRDRGLNGIYRINAGEFAAAYAYWRTIRNGSGATYDATERRFVYPLIEETYELGLWGILSERLLAASANFRGRNEVLQHAVSIASELLARQERNAGGQRLGWRTAPGNPLSLMNTETISIAVLALGANATFVFEPGHGPLSPANSSFIRGRHNVLSARLPDSTPGEMLIGPDQTLVPGTYAIDFTLRLPSGGRGDALVATVAVNDGAGELATARIGSGDLAANGDWLRYRVLTAINNPVNRMTFHVRWAGVFDLDVGPVRVIRLDTATKASPPPSSASLGSRNLTRLGRSTGRRVP